jgi:hypothetical protein
VCPGYGAKPLTWVEPRQKRTCKGKDRREENGSEADVSEMAIVKLMKPRFKGVDACMSRSFDSQAVLHAIDYCKYFNGHPYFLVISCDLIYHDA